MTGSLGGLEERRLIADTYHVDFFELPRFKPYAFLYEVDCESVSGTQEEWLQSIVDNVEGSLAATRPAHLPLAD